MTEKREELDALLAAPDHTRKNDNERRKYLERKAEQDAHKARFEFEKRGEDPTDEDLLADMVRVAHDEVTNPVWHEWGILSEKRYRRFGHYPIEVVWKRYGTFAHAKQVADLEERVGTKTFKRARTQQDLREHTGRYLERHVWPHVIDRKKLSQPLDKPYSLGVISDTHSLFLDAPTWHSFLSMIRDVKPSGILLNGDTIEGAEISTHPKIPGWTTPLQVELDFQREMVKQIREFHDGDLFINGGNHGIDRLARYMTQVAPALSGLRSMRIDELMGLGEFDVKLFQGGTIMSPEGQEDNRQGFLMFDCYYPHHGTKLGQNPARSELQTIGYSGTSGHVHRADLAYGCTLKDKGLSWMCTPMGCTEHAGRAYIKSPNMGWQKGFGMAFIYPDGDVHQYPVVTDNGRCTVEGFIYEAPDFPQPEPDHLWLPDLPLPS